MRKRLLLSLAGCMTAILFVLPAASVNAQLSQTNWKYSNPQPMGFTVLYTSFVDNNNGIAVGSNGCIGKTTDAGHTWQYGVFSFTSSAGIVQKPTFADVHFVTPTIAYAAGTSGTLIKSTDGGINWTLINNPLYAAGLNVDAVWFINKDTGYIGGPALLSTITTTNASSPDASPKLYFTHNGGTTWDSLLAPIGAPSNVGYVASPTNASIQVPITAIGKEIFRIKFVNDSVGYIVGSATGSYSLPYPGGSSSYHGGVAPLVWKFVKGTLTDYSLSKEKLGYSGIQTTPPTTTTLYNSGTLSQQIIKAFVPINDSLVLLGTYNNGMMVRLRTGRKDSTSIPTVQTAKVPGIYEITHTQNAPPGYSNIPSTGPTVPNSNMVSMDRSSNGYIYASSSLGRVIVTKDSGSTFATTAAVPASTNYANAQLYALKVTPNGRVITMGTDGVVADSLSGPWSSTYTDVKPSSAINQIDFADCKNGAVAGGFGIIHVTADSGKTWVDKTIPSFAASLISIYGMSYPVANKLFFGSSNGNIYLSADQATTNNLMFSDPVGSVIYGLTTAANGTRIWGLAYRSSAATEKTLVFRSLNGGLTWDTAKGFPTGTNAPLCQSIQFPTADTGYISGYKGKVFKTTDAGVTWVDISPNTALTTASTNALGVYDKNTAYVYLSAFPNKYVYKTTNGGVSWVNVTPNTSALASANITAFVIHDTNTVFAAYGAGRFLKTTDGGITWSVEEAPSAVGFTGGVFVPKTVPAGTPVANRRMFLGGAGSTNILIYGNPGLTNVSSTESITNVSCTNITAGAVTVTAIGGIPPYSYSLNGGAFQASNTFTGLSKGSQTLTIKDGGCQTITKTLTIGLTDNLTLTTTPATDTSVCAGAPVPLFAVSAPAATYQWTPAAGLSSATVSNPTAIVYNNSSYTVTASLNGCSRTKTIPINIKPSPTVSAGPDKTIISGSSVQLEGSGSSGSVLWSPATTLDNATIYTPTATPTTTTQYTITVTDANHCTSSDEVVVTVLPYCVKPMHAFTPNNDGVNDKWLATTGGGCTSRVSVIVYNRYGHTVYANENYQNDWNGTWKGETLPDATYYYAITYYLVDGRTIQLSGDVTILR